MRVRETWKEASAGRRTQIWRDQHGRPWEVTIDLEAGTHCVPPIPRFRAPLMPPLEYVRSDPDRLGRLRIVYEPWLREWAAAEEVFNARRLTVASVNYGEAAGSVIANNPVELRQLVGPMPQSAEFVRAAMAGNRWVLGIRKPDGREFPVPQWAADVGLDRLAHREATASELDLHVVRSRYADVDDDGQALAPLTAPRARTAQRTQRRDPFAVEVPEGFGAATNFGDALDASTDFDDEESGAAEAGYGDVEDDDPIDDDFGGLADDGLADDEPPAASATTHGPMSGAMVRTRDTRSKRRGGG